METQIGNRESATCVKDARRWRGHVCACNGCYRDRNEMYMDGFGCVVSLALSGVCVYIYDPKVSLMGYGCVVWLLCVMLLAMRQNTARSRQRRRRRRTLQQLNSRTRPIKHTQKHSHTAHSAHWRANTQKHTLTNPGSAQSARVLCYFDIIIFACRLAVDVWTCFYI